MTTVQYFKSLDLYRVWQFNKYTNIITVKFMTMDEVMYLLSTKE